MGREKRGRKRKRPNKRMNAERLVRYYNLGHARRAAAPVHAMHAQAAVRAGRRGSCAVE